VITAQRLRELLHYDPETGVFTWLVKPSKRARIRVGDVAGNVGPDGYRRIRVGCKYLSHRLAWLWMTGEWPPHQIDHINGAKHDNRICNLRVATGSQNQANARKRSDNTSGYKGVRPSRGRWRAEIRVNGSRRHIGIFNDPAEAHAAYVDAAVKHSGEFARAA
jgi:hypothetical protein